jgi:hypothetical protein
MTWQHLEHGILRVNHDKWVHKGPQLGILCFD